MALKKVPVVPPEPLLVPYKYAAVMLGVCYDTVVQLVKRGALPVVRLGKRPLIPLAALKEFAAKGYNSRIAPEHK